MVILHRCGFVVNVNSVGYVCLICYNVLVEFAKDLADWEIMYGRDMER